MALRSSQPALVRAMSATTFHDKEKAAEKQYFNVEDEKLLRVSGGQVQRRGALG